MLFPCQPSPPSPTQLCKHLGWAQGPSQPDLGKQLEGAGSGSYERFCFMVW